MSALDDVEADQNPLAMENELLQHEVRHLRARLAASEEATRVARRTAAKAPAATSASPPKGSDGVPVARDDLSWLFNRVGRSTAAFAPGDRRRLRELRRLHLGEGDA